MNEEDLAELKRLGIDIGQFQETKPENFHNQKKKKSRPKKPSTELQRIKWRRAKRRQRQRGKGFGKNEVEAYFQNLLPKTDEEKAEMVEWVRMLRENFSKAEKGKKFMQKEKKFAH